MTDEANSEDNKKDKIIEDLKKQLEAVLAKKDELLSEAKAAKNKAKELEQQKEQEAADKAKKDGDFEQLLKSSEKARDKLQKELDTIKHQVSSKEIENEAMRLASDLADGPNAKLLSRFIKDRLDFNDNQIKVKDKDGNLSVTTTEELKEEFRAMDDYKALLRGSKATGGNAAGSTGGVKAGKVINRNDFNKMDVISKNKFMRDGGTVTDTE